MTKFEKWRIKRLKKRKRPPRNWRQEFDKYEQLLIAHLRALNGNPRYRNSRLADEAYQVARFHFEAFTPWASPARREKADRLLELLDQHYPSNQSTRSR